MNQPKNNHDISSDQKKREKLMVQPDILSYRDEIAILEKEELRRDLAAANLEYAERKEKRLVQESFLAKCYSFSEELEHFIIQNVRNRQKLHFAETQKLFLELAAKHLKSIFGSEVFCFYVNDEEAKQHFNLINNLKKQKLNLKEIVKVYFAMAEEYILLNKDRNMFEFNLKPRLQDDFLLIPLQSHGFRSLNGILFIKVDKSKLDEHYLVQADFLREDLHRVYFDVFRHVK